MMIKKTGTGLFLLVRFIGFSRFFVICFYTRASVPFGEEAISVKDCL
jgi:hypothetical protein